MRLMDFNSWQGVLATLAGIVLFALVAVGIRMLFRMVLQDRQQRMNRQINERLKTLIAAYRTLGGSFSAEPPPAPGDAAEPPDRAPPVREAVEAALADILLLGTDELVRLAAGVAGDLVAGRPVQTATLVIALRDYIRLALDLEPIPPSLDIPMQGPSRQPASPRAARAEARDRPAPGER